jgi:2-C-methyl-D-erythritol 4-phosphate cytidylyltransferase/2-C-methyl-D-erythritol 2,4-cyclodiphosphate synthase
LKYDNKVVDRSNYSLTQTPQGFAFKVIYELHQRWKEESYTDDISLCLAAGVEVGVAVGEQINFKVTFPEDLAYAEKIMNHKYKKMSIRVGSGFDVHRYKPAVAAKIPICGVLVESEWAVEAHSDGDVGLHAITDALLGAVACGDIGEHFPPSDPKWQGVDSAVFLKHAHELVIQRGGSINNVDVTIICERPKVSAYKQQMAERVADILKIKPNQVGIKATTTEKMGALGRMEGIAAQAICSINIINPEEN